MRVFISYRRQDSAAWASRLFDALSSRYGPREIFLDAANISVGLDWRHYIEDAIAKSDAVLAVIGPHWLDAGYRDQVRRRIDDPDDLVRSQLRAAIELKKTLVPVLVGGATMPSPDMLPDDIRSLANHEGASLRDTTWNEDIARLTTVLEAPGDSARFR